MKSIIEEPGCLLFALYQMSVQLPLLHAAILDLLSAKVYDK